MKGSNKIIAVYVRPAEESKVSEEKAAAELARILYEQIRNRRGNDEEN